MIYPEIKNYLIQVTDAPVVDLFDRAVEVFERMGFEDYLEVFENAVGDNSDAGDVVVLDALVRNLQEMIDSILTMHGVTINSHVTLSERISLADSICRIIDFEDKHAIMLALESEESEQEIFASVVSLTSGIAMDNVLSWLDEVSDALVGKLKELVLQPELERMEDAQEVAQRIEEYNKYKIVFQNDIRWADRFVNHAEAIDLPFASYAKLYMAEQLKQDVDDNEALSMRRVCVNLIGIACLSSDGSRATQVNARPYLELIYSDMTQLTKLDIMLSSILMEFNRAQT